MKLAEAALEASYVQKRGTNKEQGYAFAQYQDVAAEVNEAIAKRGISVAVSYEQWAREQRATRSGSAVYYVALCATLTLTDGETGETLITQGPGEGLDTGDKAINKAVTNCLKNAWRAALTMSFGTEPDEESPELREEKPKAKKATPAPRKAGMAGDLIATIPHGLPAEQVLTGSIMLAELDRVVNLHDLEKWYAQRSDALGALDEKVKEAVRHGYGRTKQRLTEGEASGN